RRSEIQGRYLDAARAERHAKSARAGAGQQSAGIARRAGGARETRVVARSAGADRDGRTDESVTATAAATIAGATTDTIADGATGRSDRSEHTIRGRHIADWTIRDQSINATHLHIYPSRPG